jgi:hypothetical protein
MDEPVAARDLGALLRGDGEGGWSRRCEIRLACGLVMPTIDVGATAQRQWDGQVMVQLRIGSDETGNVHCGMQWSPTELMWVDVPDFFSSEQLAPGYRAAMAERTSTSAPHVFMLLVDELIYWAGRDRMRPGCTVELDDAVDLDYATGPTPFALRGRTVFSGARESSFLQWARGYGYYETFGFWPAGEQPAAYMDRMSRATSRLGTAPGDADYDDTAAAIGRQRVDKMVKALPPVLPPLGTDLRTFTDMDDYYQRVLAVGSYGRPVGRAAGGARGAPAEHAADAAEHAAAAVHAFAVARSTLPAIDAAAVIDAMRAGGRLPPSVVDGVPAPNGVQASRKLGTHFVGLGDWNIRIKPLDVVVTGPTTHVPQVTRLAERLAAEYAPGASIVWNIARTPQRLYVRGTAHRASDGRFLARGAEQLAALGYLPVVRNSVPAPDAHALIQQARMADDQVGGEFVASTHPRFPHYQRLATALRTDLWVRAP